MAIKSCCVSKLDWVLSGYTPFEWQMGECKEIGIAASPEIGPIPVSVPGSVQKALLNAGLIPDWNIGLNAKKIEWIENRHWLFETKLPKSWFRKNSNYKLKFLGLDNKGSVYINDHRVYDFNNSHIDHSVEISPFLKYDDTNLLQVIFECPPRWLGQFHWSSKIRDWKPRFYYTWDWTSRMVQTGICDDIFIEQIPDNRFESIYFQTDYDIHKQKGILEIKAALSASDHTDIEVKLIKEGKVLFEKQVNKTDIETGLKFEDLNIQPWWPNNMGNQNLYDIEVTLLDSNETYDKITKRIGFKNIKWDKCKGSSENADPWLCKINGKELFLQGVNWTPIRPNFADVKKDQYRKRLDFYRSIGLNILRVWGGFTLEKQIFYDLCDELGLLVWQELPLSSSGLENFPPDDYEIVEQYKLITDSYIKRRHHHACLLLWSGGNELTDKQGNPLGLEHPLFEAANNIIKQKDPQHRFIPTSPSGPSYLGKKENYGKNMHWDVHGPWKVLGSLSTDWQDYWNKDDALFRSELGAPGPSDLCLIEKYSGNCNTLPSCKNPLWKRTGWWLELEQYLKENENVLNSAQDYIKWGQNRQSKILTTAAKACKSRFPACGGLIIWMGHDSFPCTSNTSIVDFEGNPKPAAMELAKIFK
jgi:beta-mannosidase